MYSRIRASGLANGCPYQPSTTWGPETPRPRMKRPPQRWSSDIAAIAVAAGARAEICDDRGPELDPLGRGAPPGQRGERVRAVGLGRPHRVKAQPVGLEHGLGRARRRTARPVADVEPELEVVCHGSGP